jgi:hypothetical protein
MCPTEHGPEADGTGETQQTVNLRPDLPLTNPQLYGSNTNLVMGSRLIPDTKTDWSTDRQLY